MGGEGSMFISSDYKSQVKTLMEMRDYAKDRRRYIAEKLGAILLHNEYTSRYISSFGR